MAQTRHRSLGATGQAEYRTPLPAFEAGFILKHLLSELAPFFDGTRQQCLRLSRLKQIRRNGHGVQTACVQSVTGEHGSLKTKIDTRLGYGRGWQ